MLHVDVNNTALDLATNVATVAVSPLSSACAPATHAQQADGHIDIQQIIIERRHRQDENLFCKEKTINFDDIFDRKQSDLSSNQPSPDQPDIPDIGSDT